MKTQEPCIRKCKFIRTIHNDERFCKLYDVEITKTLLPDEYDEGYEERCLKCQDCLEKDLSNNIDKKIEEIKDVYDIFVYEMDCMFHQLDGLKIKRRGIYED